MQKISIETTQNVTIDYDIAGIGDRVIAGLLDFLIMFGYLIGIIILLTFFDQINLGFEFGIAIWIILYLPVFFYDFLCEIFMDGQSFGKKARKIKIIKMDGSQPTIGSYFLRWILKPIDVYFTYGSVGIITLFINGKGQRLGDLAANTTAIKMKQTLRFEDTVFYNIPENYDLKFPQVSLLNDNDIRVIKDVINLNNRKIETLVYEKILTKTKEVIF
ncbi:MAG TPA: RDD family protein [Ignavibacteriaceae bacterium]|nr:RDD family protein [Ignavibacteriaceae bacterium]